jgi:hypothetical protein
VFVCERVFVTVFAGVGTYESMYSKYVCMYDEVRVRVHNYVYVRLGGQHACTCSVVIYCMHIKLCIRSASPHSFLSII